jgi:protein involved in polysaccharide export with SLBB domain
MVIPTLAAPIVDAASHKLVGQAQPNAQPETLQRIHIAVIGEVQLPEAYFLDKADGSSTAQQQLPTVTQAIRAAGGVNPLAFNLQSVEQILLPLQHQSYREELSD